MNDNEVGTATQLPTPCGYKILCALPDIGDKLGSGILDKPDQTKFNEAILCNVLFVVAVGPDAYSDAERYPNGPWCKEGDFVIVKSNAGTRVEIHGKEFRLINEDTPEAVVQDPRGIRRI